MTNPTFVTPQAGSGGITLRPVPQINPATQVGLLDEGARLELDAPDADWHTAKVCVVIQPEHYGGLITGVYDRFKALKEA